MLPTGAGEASKAAACREQGHLPATLRPIPIRLCRTPEEEFEMKKHEHAASIPDGCTEQDHSPSTGNPGRDEDAPPLPSTELAFEKKQEQEHHPLGSLPADVLVEILPRVPYKSLCRFKCVSKPWLALCSDTDIRKRCPQTLAGFFYSYRGCSKFHNLSGRGPPLVDPSLPFLRGSYDRFTIEQCCGGLLLCKCWDSRDEGGEYDSDYVVCNPMTAQWVVLPPVVLRVREDEVDYLECFEPVDIFLGFDAAVSPRFVVFVPLTDYFPVFTEMAIYSSETGRWTRVQSEWGHKVILLLYSERVFLNGTMHLAINNASVLTVDAEGKVWGEFDRPEHAPSYDKVCIGRSQGRLYAWHIDTGVQHVHVHLYVWVLEDYVSGIWTLKHDAPVSELFGRPPGEDVRSYTAFAMHPDCDCIFLTDEEEMAVSYDLDSRKVIASCTFEEFQDVLPYIPCFAEWSSDGH